MEKVFEDYFSEIQSNMVSVALEYVDGQADRLYLYGSCENNMYTFDFFVEINKKFFHIHKLNDANNGFKYDVSIKRQKYAIKFGVDAIEEIADLCKKYQMEVPTEMKLIYDVKSNSLSALYEYDLMYSNTDDKTSVDIFNQWFEEVSQQEE